MKRFRGGLVFDAHRLVYHSTQGLRAIKKKSLAAHVHLSLAENVGAFLHVFFPLVEFLDKAAFRVQGLGFGVQDLGFRVWGLRGGSFSGADGHRRTQHFQRSTLAQTSSIFVFDFVFRGKHV